MTRNKAAEMVVHLDAHHRLMWSLAVSAIAFLASGGLVLATRLVVTWDAGAALYLILAWITIVQAKPSIVRKTVKMQDSSLTFLFLLLVTASTVALLAVGLVLGPSKNLPDAERLPHIALSIIAVVSSWLLTHTSFGLRYAHIYYGPGREGGWSGGLLFPGKEDPDYLDFVYFSYVIGMTCQVSDTQIASRRLRRIALVHGVLSFGFNTIILALSINIVSAMI